MLPAGLANIGILRILPHVFHSLVSDTRTHVDPPYRAFHLRLHIHLPASSPAPCRASPGRKKFSSSFLLLRFAIFRQPAVHRQFSRENAAALSFTNSFNSHINYNMCTNYNINAMTCNYKRCQSQKNLKKADVSAI